VGNLTRIVIALAVMAAPATARAQGPAAEPRLDTNRLAYFSPQRAYSLSAAGQAAQARLTALQTERAREIEARTRTLETQQQQLQQSSSLLTETARGQRVKELEKFEVDLQRFIQDAQAEITGFQRDVESEFLARLRPALDQVAKDRSLWLVFNEDAGLIAWANPVLDITSEVVKRIDQP
jgi:Skp family chaperone for outer membrane proteins